MNIPARNAVGSPPGKKLSGVEKMAANSIAPGERFMVVKAGELEERDLRREVAEAQPGRVFLLNREAVVPTGDNRE
eukprot:CAMPEP_0114140148 /NCGR_PEP_ID=MMETSP0043_2-20121206/17226_1 /TAXON_ID=464988 /ORGANISM="Hemiselmis andersenii, Strain CCMP644" /LENGTH=75 /DNA_ID=CAMNT_0001234215 /DNA_START=535 /DNA_END=762 /DNA_ORIENTATION=+